MRGLISGILAISLAFSHLSYASDVLEFESSAPSPKKQNPAVPAGSISEAPPFELTPIGSTMATMGANKEQQDPHLVVQMPLPSGETAQITVAEREHVTIQELSEMVNKPEIQGLPMIVSTDNERVINAVLASEAKQKEKRILRILPIGKLATLKDNLVTGFNEYKTNAYNTLTADPIGLTVLTVTVGIDTYIWFHSANFSIHQKWSMFLMNVFMAATFGLDRELWGKLTNPVRNRMIGLLDRSLKTESFQSEVSKGRITRIKDIVGTYISNVAYGTGIQSSRLGFLNLSSAVETLKGTAFWGEALKISSLVSASGFTWTEVYRVADAEKQPVSKRMLRRLSELRGIIMSCLTSVSMILQPQVYGAIPLVSFIVHLSIGGLIMWRKDKFVNWLQTSERVFKVYRKIQTLEKFMLTLGGYRAFRCKILFQKF